MKTNEEIEKEAQKDFDNFSNHFDWQTWKTAYLFGYKQGLIDLMEENINSCK